MINLDAAHLPGGRSAIQLQFLPGPALYAGTL
jgi:hypothetical protein